MDTEFLIHCFFYLLVLWLAVYKAVRSKRYSAQFLLLSTLLVISAVSTLDLVGRMLDQATYIPPSKYVQTLLDIKQHKGIGHVE